MKCPESIEELEELERLEKIKPEMIETEDYVYIPFSRKRLALSICPHPQTTEEIKTYFVTDGQSIKIGKATNINMRLKELQSGNPNGLTPTIIIFSDSEKFFHDHFKKRKIRNEWFCLPENYVEIVKTICEKNNLKFQVRI